MLHFIVEANCVDLLTQT